tara:strand:- start:5478 stop:6350 length:873 start_codon:yes stop_codon:yes gene_type:complete
MTIITLTFGYGEVQPLGEIGKIWSILVIIFGVSGIGVLVTTLREEIMQIDQYKKRKMMKKISKLKNHLIICGYGRMGAVIAKELAEKEIDFIIIEQNDDKIESIRENAMYCIHGDVTKEETLKESRIEHATGAAVVLDTDQDNLFVTMSIRTYNPELFLLSRCAVEDNKHKLIRAGANKVVNPYTAGGHRMAEMLTKPNVEDSVTITTPKYDNIDFSLDEISLKNLTDYHGLKIHDTNIKTKYNLLIVGIINDDGKSVINPDSNTILNANDVILLMGDPNMLTEFKSTLK